MSCGSWDRPSTLKLIDLYKSHELLVNPKHHLYKDRESRKEVLESIVKEINSIRPGTTLQDVTSKWNSLNTAFYKSGKLKDENVRCNSEILFLKSVKKTDPLRGVQENTKENGVRKEIESDSNKIMEEKEEKLRARANKSSPITMQEWDKLGEYIALQGKILNKPTVALKLQESIFRAIIEAKKEDMD